MADQLKTETVQLSAAEREQLMIAWPWPREAATTRDGLGQVVKVVETILAARLAAIDRRTRVSPPAEPCCDEGMTCLECDPDATFADFHGSSDVVLPPEQTGAQS